MDRLTSMLELARRLEQASAQRDWAALGRADAELVAQLPSWGDRRGQRHVHRLLCKIAVRAVDHRPPSQLLLCA
jgi:urease accessory protein UreF